MTEITVSPFQLLQWKHAIRLEQKGIKIARRSVNAHAGKRFGLGAHAKRETVLAHIERALGACSADGVPANQRVRLEVSDAEV